jgi:hypothetical protein
MLKKILVFTFLTLSISANAAVSYTFGLKLDDLSEYEDFIVEDIRCADAGSGGIYSVDQNYGCQAAGFLLVDIQPSEEETFDPGFDSLLLTVDKIKDGGEILGGTIKFTLVDPQTYIPVSGDLKAASELRFGDFDFTDLGGGMYEGSFDGCLSNDLPNCSAISNIEITFNELQPQPPAGVPLPAAAWLFGSAILGLGVVKRRSHS